MDVYINIFIGFCIFVIGTLFGSFFSLATYRIPRHQDIVIKRSYCPNCKHVLGFFDLIPILSFIFCGGKCRYCKEKISTRYILFEILNGLVFLTLYVILGYTINLLVILLIYVMLFLLFGSLVMKSKMSKEETEEINNLKIQKLNKKKGVYITEIVLAMIFFMVLLTSSYVISRNYNKNSAATIYRSAAVEIAVKNIEVIKATNYDSIVNYNYEIENDNVKYNINIEVVDFDKVDKSFDNIAKKISVTVAYNYEGVPYEYTLTTLKGKVNT